MSGDKQYIFNKNEFIERFCLKENKINEGGTNGK